MSRLCERISGENATERCYLQFGALGYSALDIWFVCEDFQNNASLIVLTIVLFCFRADVRALSAFCPVHLHCICL